MSPSTIPPLSAALPLVTWLTAAPIGPGSPRASARFLVTSVMLTPRNPLLTFPAFLSCSTTLIAILDGIENDRPTDPPVGEYIWELMPTTSPSKLNKGPPEFPRFIATSV